MRAATSAAAALLRLPDIGRVGEGAAADLVLYDANPLEDVEAVRKPSMVMRAGDMVPIASV
jgi:imidazolonepropionase-like amidohydrolase